MFPFVGAPMFYTARRRKRKWTILSCVEGAVASGDVIVVAPPFSATSQQDVPCGGGGGDQEAEGASFSGGDDSRRRSIIELGVNIQAEIGTEGAVLSSSSLAASTSTSLELANVDSSSPTALRILSKKHHRRSSSLHVRGEVNSPVRSDTDRVCPASSASVTAYGDEIAVSALGCLLEQCAKWDFDAFLLNRLSGGHSVVALGCKIFQTHQFHRVFQLDWTALLQCLHMIEHGYKENPYHNAIHAADVAQAMHCFLQEAPLASALDPLEKMACILAAFGHDLYHPGFNQKFLEGNEHFLCRLYNRVSVLENFHWRCLVGIVKESSLFDHLTREQWRKLLHMFQVLILATDMQRQQEYLNQFKEFLSTHVCDNAAEDNTNKPTLTQLYSDRGERSHLNGPEERLFVMQILIKCADIANPCRPWDISKEWSYRASAEFFNQGDEERRLGLPVTSFCDRFATSVAKIQSGFMEYVAQPLFMDWDQYMRSPLSSYMLRNLRFNCQNWNKALREQVQQQELSQQRLQVSQTSSPASSVGGLQASQPPQTISAASSLEEMAELEMQKPDVLKRRASSSAVPRSRSPRTSYQDLPRRISLPVTVGSGATLWTASANRRIYEAISTSDIANAPIRLQLSHSEVAEEDGDEGEPSRHEAIEEGEETLDSARTEDEEAMGRQATGGGCTGSGCGTPTPPPPFIVVSQSTTQDWSGETIDSTTEKDPNTWMATPSPQQTERRFSEPLVLTLANFCSMPSTETKQRQHGDDNGLFPNLVLLQRCMPRRGSLPMTQKELEDVQANSSISPAVPLIARGNSAVPENVPASLGRFVGVS